MNQVVHYFLFLILLISCAKYGPVEIRRGSENCAFCMMKILNEKFHSQSRSGKGRYYHFDSIECMSAWSLRHNDNEANHWVRDYNSGGWLDEKKAVITQSTKIRSPMGLGLAAFANKPEAEDSIKDNNIKILDEANLNTTVSSWAASMKLNTGNN